MLHIADMLTSTLYIALLIVFLFSPMPLLYHLFSGVWALTSATYCYEMHGRFQTVVITDVILFNFRKLS